MNQVQQSQCHFSQPTTTPTTIPNVVLPPTYCSQSSNTTKSLFFLPFFFSFGHKNHLVEVRMSRTLSFTGPSVSVLVVVVVVVVRSVEPSASLSSASRTCTCSHSGRGCERRLLLSDLLLLLLLLRGRVWIPPLTFRARAAREVNVDKRAVTHTHTHTHAHSRTHTYAGRHARGLKQGRVGRGDVVTWRSVC